MHNAPLNLAATWRGKTVPQLHIVERAGMPLFAAGLLGLGIINLLHADFAFQWQPVPKEVPGRTAIAYAVAILMVGGAGGLMFDRSRHIASLVMAGLLAAWCVLLHVPRVVAAPTDVSIWLGLAEIAALAAAGLLLSLEARQKPAPKLYALAIGLFGASAIIFGLAHFVYADFTAGMVPAWIGAGIFWAYFTGAAHAAAGVAILLRVFSQLAATMLGIMFASWVVLLHAPRVYADPNRLELTMIMIAIALTGSAWLVARALGQRSQA